MEKNISRKKQKIKGIKGRKDKKKIKMYDNRNKEIF